MNTKTPPAETDGVPKLQAQVIPPISSPGRWLVNYFTWAPFDGLPVDDNSIAFAFRAWFALRHNQPALSSPNMLLTKASRNGMMGE